VIRIGRSEDAVVVGEHPAAAVPDLPVDVTYDWPAVGSGLGRDRVSVPGRGSDDGDVSRRFGC